jgi:hypothetical protein
MVNFILGLIIGAGAMAYWYYHNKKKMNALVKSLTEKVNELLEKKNG